MDCRHLSIECASAPGYLADRRPSPGHGSAGSKAPSPASFAGTPRKNVRALEALACRRRPPLLASLLEQARPAHFRDFALARRSALLTEVTNVTTPLKASLSRVNRRHACRAVRILGDRLGRGRSGARIARS